MNIGNRVFAVQGYAVTQNYARHVEAVKNGGYAQGIDLVPQKDNRYIPSSIVAHSDGTVLYAGNGDGYGNAVWILHNDNYVTGYGHMRELRVKTGDAVKRGDVIGVVGNTGHSTGIHLHFEVRKYKKPYTVNAGDFWGANSFMNTSKFDWVDPTPYINADLPNQTPKVESSTDKYYRVQVGAFKDKAYAVNMARGVRSKGFDTIIKYYEGNYHVQVGAYEAYWCAVAMKARLIAAGYKTFITNKTGQDIAF